MSVKQLAAITLLLLVAGCSPAPAPTPSAPIALSLSPESGAPGTTVTATLRVREPDRVGRRERDGSFLGWVCFQACAGGGATASTTFKPSQAEPGVFTGLFTVPLVLGNKDAPGRFDPVAAGSIRFTPRACWIRPAAAAAGPR